MNFAISRFACWVQADAPVGIRLRESLVEQTRDLLVQGPPGLLIGAEERADEVVRVSPSHPSSRSG